MKEKNIKTYGLIIGIVLFLILIAGLSYAWYAGQAANNNTIQGEIGMCFEANSTKGEDISGDDLLLLKKDNYISNNQITIGNGMVVTSISAGIDITSCPDTYGYMDVYMKDTTVNSAFINGNSVGALKYVIASYDSNTYPTTTVSELMGETFDIVKEGAVDTASDKLIFTDPMLPRGSLADYLIIFYLDGDLTFNDSSNTNFTTTISAIARPSTDGTAKSYISNLAAPTSTVVNNSITYNVNTDHNVIVDTRENIRFYGADPDNYIYFNCDTYPDTNCELWRVIGVVDGKIKIIRSSPIGKYSWDTSESTVASGYGIHQWGESVYSADNSPYSGADLMKLLNPGYESNQDLDKDGNTITVNNSLYYNSESGTCYSQRSNVTTSCNFTSTGVQGIKNAATKNKIADTIYYMGGLADVGVAYSNTILEVERGTTIVTNPSDGVTRTTTWLGKIALPYASDYVYAADLSLCVNKKINTYKDAACISNNWMRGIINSGNNHGWLINTTTNIVRSSCAMGVYSSGNVDNVSLYRPINYIVAPVLYLPENEVIISGTGTIDNPYRLSA